MVRRESNRMTDMPSRTTVDETVDTILNGYHAYRHYFQEITSRAMNRFVDGDWPGLQADAIERLDAYQKILQQVVTDLADALGPRSEDRNLWTAVKSAITPALDRVASPDLAETFFNSVVRRLGNIVGRKSTSQSQLALIGDLCSDRPVEGSARAAWHPGDACIQKEMLPRITSCELDG